MEVINDIVSQPLSSVSYHIEALPKGAISAKFNSGFSHLFFSAYRESEVRQSNDLRRDERTLVFF